MHRATMRIGESSQAMVAWRADGLDAVGR